MEDVSILCFIMPVINFLTASFNKLSLQPFF